MKFVVDCFTSMTAGTKFPENTYEATTVDEVARIIHNVSRREAGIIKIEVWVEEPHDEDPVERL